MAEQRLSWSSSMQMSTSWEAASCAAINDRSSPYHPILFLYELKLNVKLC
jgi:hypothetical protein